MRTREEILIDSIRRGQAGNAEYAGEIIQTALTVELLLDIRDLLAGVVSKEDILAEIHPVTKEDVSDLLQAGSKEREV